MRGASRTKADRKSPFNHLQKLAFQNVELGGGDSTDFCIYAVAAE